MTIPEKFIDKRLEDIETATFEPLIPGLEGLLFVKLDNKTKGIASRAYSKAVMDFYKEGLPSEHGLPEMLKQMVTAQLGLDINEVLTKQMALQKRIYDTAPEDLIQPEQLTEEEIAQLSPEETQEREIKQMEQAKKLVDYYKETFTTEEMQVFAQVKQIEAMERELHNNTAEYHASRIRMETEIFHSARQTDNPDKQYFKSIEDIPAMDEINNEGLVQLYLKWTQFKRGMLPNYFRADSVAQPGMAGNMEGSEG